MERAAFLGSVDVLHDLSQEEILRVDAYVSTDRYQAEQYVYYENDPGNRLYFIRKGKISIELAGKTIKEYAVGESFGEVAFIDKSLRYGSARTLTDTVLDSVDEATLYDPSKVSPVTALKIHRAMAAKVIGYLRSNLMTTTRFLIEQGESEHLEFKSTLRQNLFTQKFDKEIEHAVLKTVAAFLNSEGGTLLIGVDDKRHVTGLDADRFPSSDRAMLHFTNTVNDRIGAGHMSFIDCYTEKIGKKEIMRIDVRPADLPAYLTHNDEEKFYIRTGPSTTSLRISDLFDYLRTRFYHVISSANQNKAP